MGKNKMIDYPKKIENEDQLEELLSRPSEETIKLFKELDGDIILLGIAGKIGPSLAKMAKRACDESLVKKRIIGVSLEEIHLGKFDNSTPKMLTLAHQITDSNAAFFDAANNFKGCIAGLHEVLRRQGLLEGIWTLNPDENLSQGQMEEIDRVYKTYPHLNDDEYISENLADWIN